MSPWEFLFKSFNFKITFKMLCFHIQNLSLECIQFLFKNNLTSSCRKDPLIWILLCPSRAGPWSTLRNYLYFFTLTIFVTRSWLRALIRLYPMVTTRLVIWSDIFISQLNQFIFIVSIPFFPNLILSKYIIQMMLLNTFFNRDMTFPTHVSLTLLKFYLLI